MATITATSITGSGDRQATITTLGASDTFDYKAGADPILVLNNVTAGALTVNLVGDNATTVPVSGIGEVDVSGGFDTGSIPAGEVYVIPLRSVGKYLSGTVTVTGGDGIEAALLES